MMLQQPCPYCGCPGCNHYGLTTVGWDTNRWVIYTPPEEPRKSLDDGKDTMWLHWVIPQRNLQPEVRRHARHYPNSPGPTIAPQHAARSRTPNHAFGHSPRKG
jgi:hypothetical protein